LVLLLLFRSGRRRFLAALSAMMRR